MRLCNVGSCHDCIFAAAGSGGSGGSALDASLCYPTSMSSLEASLTHPPSLAIVRMHSHSKVQVYRHAKALQSGSMRLQRKGVEERVGQASSRRTFRGLASEPPAPPRRTPLISPGFVPRRALAAAQTQPRFLALNPTLGTGRGSKLNLKVEPCKGPRASLEIDNISGVLGMSD